MPSTLFTNASLILDGFAERQTSFDVLVQGNAIQAVSARPLDRGDATVIDVAGRTLMPGLIDAHAHITGLSLSPKNISDPASEIALAAASYLRNSLMDGFTTIREAGGADHSMARLLAEGAIVGPRLFYSGRALTQTGGGADFRTPDELNDPCGHVSPFSVMSVIVDGVDEVRKAAREELRRERRRSSCSRQAASSSRRNLTRRSTSSRRRNCRPPSRRRRLAAPTSWRMSTPTRGSGDAFGLACAPSSTPIS